jgi:cytochrome oxidase Cu insertion factor (SCO1/SenC/PrrC family)
LKKISLARAVVAVLLVAVLLAGAGSIIAFFGTEPATGTSSGGTSPGSDTGGAGAPQFSGVTLDGEIVTLDQFRGKPLLLVYMTSG